MSAESQPNFQEVTQSPDAIQAAATGADLVEAYGEQPDEVHIAVTSLHQTIADMGQGNTAN